MSLNKRPQGLVLGIDFDGCIHNKAEPLEGKKMGAPLPGAVNAMERLYDAGHKLIVHTTMARTEPGQKVVEDWLDYYGIEYHEVTALKPIAAIYIDDKALRHTDWTTTLAEMQVLLDIRLEDD